ncbi:hypothetical protein LEP3755_11870 [Leptolyngbya sp. NIES-3755]|nr:hypothetical protein LEP3755_11870 [Leptolyngbya sp. NIES-3755]
MTELTVMLDDEVLRKMQEWAERQNLTIEQAMSIACTQGIAVLENSTPPKTLSLEERKAFLTLPLAERRRLLAEQAEEMVAHYEQNREWQDIAPGDLIEY